MADVLEATLERETAGACENATRGWWVMDGESPRVLGHILFFPLPWFSHLCNGNFGHVYLLGPSARKVLLNPPAQRQLSDILMAAVGMRLFMSSLAFCATHKP